jgi:septum formation protein
MNSIHHLILASNSPRRQELMKQAGFQFQIVTYDFEEILPRTIPPTEAAEYLAKEKNAFYRSKLENQVIITADTTVVLDNKVFNKPKNVTEAQQMIHAFSGKTHEVISGVCVSNLKKCISFTDITSVTFDDISKKESAYYIEKYNPMDKAGAYGIQEWIGLTKISNISGSYFNVVGLPIHRLYQILKNDFGISPID